MNPFKLIGILLVLQFANMNSFAQNKYDQQWTIGFYPSFISFTNDSIVFKPLKADFLNFPYGFIASAYSSICNPITGDFAITTNCNKIFTDSITIMKNGDYLLKLSIFKFIGKFLKKFSFTFLLESMIALIRVLRTVRSTRI